MRVHLHRGTVNRVYSITKWSWISLFLIKINSVVRESYGTIVSAKNERFYFYIKMIASLFGKESVSYNTKGKLLLIVRRDFKLCTIQRLSQHMLPVVIALSSHIIQNMKRSFISKNGDYT